MPRLATRRDPEDDDDNFDENGLLRDGRTIRVEAQMMDSDCPPQRGPFRPLRPLDARHVVDVFAGHRPGYATSSQLIDADAVAERDRVWQERGRLQRELWRQEPWQRPARSTERAPGQARRLPADPIPIRSVEPLYGLA